MSYSQLAEIESVGVTYRVVEADQFRFLVTATVAHTERIAEFTDYRAALQHVLSLVERDDLAEIAS